MKILLLFLSLTAATTLPAQIEWLSWEEAISRSERNPKKILVDVYTEWCGWCKKMDKAVFTDPAITSFISENFYAVKLDAEQREDINYAGYTFKFDPSNGRRGAHDLAVKLLDGRMSFPSIVYLDENRDRITISPGFKPASKYIHELNFIEGGHYQSKTYQQYLASLGN